MAGFNFGSATSGAVGGAGVGSYFGPIGTGVGAATGFLTGGLFGGKKKKPKKISTLDEKQQSVYDQYVQSLMGGGGQFSQDFGFDPQALQQVYQQNFAQPAYQQFQEEVVPGITGSFRGSNLQNSSYTGEALARAGTRVQQDLNAKMSSMLYNAQQDAINRRMDAVKNILNTQTFDYQQQGPSQFDQLLSGVAEHAGKFLMNKYMPINSGGG